MVQPPEAPPVGELLKSLARDTGELVRQQVQLAAAEMAAKSRVASKNAVAIAVGGAMVHLGCLGVLAAIVIALGPVVPLWLSSLGVGVIVLVAGGVLIRRGLRALERWSPVPEETLATLRSEMALGKEVVQ